MNQIKLLLIFCFFLFIGCINKQERTKNQLLTPLMTNLTDSFISLYHPQYIELHINKITPHYYLMLLYGGSSPLCEQSAFYSTKIKGHNVVIYTGFENFIKNSDKPSVDLSSKVDQSKIREGHFWIIREISNNLSIANANETVRSPFKPASGFISSQELIDKGYVYNIIDSINEKNQVK